MFVCSKPFLIAIFIVASSILLLYFREYIDCTDISERKQLTVCPQDKTHTSFCFPFELRVISLCNPIWVSLLLICMIQGLKSPQKTPVCYLCRDTRADAETTELFSVGLSLMYQSLTASVCCLCSLSGWIKPLRPLDVILGSRQPSCLLRELKRGLIWL